jgi:hypothetical protein
MAETPKLPKEALDMLARRRDVLARQFDAEAEVAKARAELARLEGDLLKAGFHIDTNEPAVW